jgi:hypothetical protein
MMKTMKLALGLALLATPSVAYGALLSASVDVDPGTEATVFTVPSGQSFRLTTVCAKSAVVRSEDVGTLAWVFSTPNMSSSQCFSFAPGVALPPGDEITCAAFAGLNPSFCLISGVHKP